MSKALITTSLKALRRLAVAKQRLTGKLPQRATKEHLVSVVGDLCYVQWDPVDAVAPSHMISLWSRVGHFRRSDLEGLLWDDRKLFLHWNPASIVRTEDYPICHSLMRRYPESISKSWGGWRRSASKFLDEHKMLRKRLLSELRKKGPLRANQFQDYARIKSSPEWTSGSDVSSMLFHLLMKGEVMVVGHEGNQNVWGLAEGFLPKWVERRVLTEDEFERAAAQRAIRALGIASSREIHYYFPRARYLKLEKTIEGLENESMILRVHIEGLGERDECYIHERDIPELELMDGDEWEPRMTLLAPFDNLICERGRTNRIFGFDYKHENFLPPSKREFGTFVHPILCGDMLIGRADLLRAKTREKLLVKSVHAEPHAPADRGIGSKIRETIEDLAEFVGAKRVEYTSHVPVQWKNSLR